MPPKIIFPFEEIQYIYQESSHVPSKSQRVSTNNILEQISEN